MDREEVNAALESMADDYLKYLKVDIKNEKSKVEADIEGMMKKLGELQSILDMITVDTSLSLDSLVPLVTKKYKDMQPIFEQVDRLESIVKIVSKSVEEMEQYLDEAETVLPPESPLKTFFKPIFGKKSNPPASTRCREHHPPSIFSTADLFRRDENDGA